MKARITHTLQKKLLGLLLSEEQTELTKGVCSELDAEFISAGAEDAHRSAAELLGEKTAACADEGFPVPEEPLLLFAGFDRKELDRALDLLKAAGVHIPLKAVCTPHNRQWSLAHLSKELSTEHRAMHGGGSQ